MFINILLLALILLTALSFGWLTRRGLLIRQPLIKWPLTFLGGLLTLLVALVAGSATLGVIKYYTPKSHAVQEIEVEGSTEQIERGRHLASAFCVECHSTTADFPMAGGVDMGRDLPINMGSYVSGNLTPAGRLGEWSDGEIFRALRDNVDQQGNRLVFMAATNVRYISDEDMYALIAFLRSHEPVEDTLTMPLDQPNLLGIIMLGANLIPDRPLVEGVIEAPEKAPTPEYGQFMMTFLDCKSCHGEDLRGGTSPVSPKGPALGFVKDWTAEQFITTLRTGKDPSGRELSKLMPWRSTGRLDDLELIALYEYIVSLPDPQD